MNQIVASEILRNHGYLVGVVGDGRLAIEAARSGQYDLVLMDCQMPHVDAFEATREIRRREAGDVQPSGRRLPVIALTANAIKGDRERCLEAGIDAYVSKPIKAKRLVEAIDSLLSNTGDPHMDEAPEPLNSPGKEETVGSAAARYTLPPFGIDDLLELCMGNLATAAVVLKEFEQQAVSDLGKVQKGVADNDPGGVAAAAHALKGAAAMLRADEVRRAATDLERIGRSEDLSQARQSVDALREEVRRCLDYLPEARTLVAEKARARTGGAA